MGAFLCQHGASKIKNTIVRNSFSAVAYTACNITHTIEKPIAALFFQLRKLFLLVLHERALPTAQSFFTKSNDGTVTAHYVPFAREKSLISLTSV